MLVEAMKQALEFIDSVKVHPTQIATRDALHTALRAAIEQAEKPVAWMYDFLSDNEVIRDWVTQSYDDIKRENGFNVRPLYTAPREWIGLTTREIEDEWERVTGHSILGGDRSAGRTMFLSGDEVIHYTQAIEAKLKEKNHAG